MRESLKITGMALLALLLLAALAADAVRPAVPVSAAAVRTPVVVLDAGHGGMDGGAVGAGGTVERDINLAVARKTELLLVLLGVRTVMTRSGDSDIAPPGEYGTIRARKVADMHARLELTESFSDPVLLSIHMNRYSRPEYRGAQVFWAGTDGSKALAEQLQANLIAFADPGNTRTAAAVDPDLFLYRSVRCPAVLAECGFLSNPQEEAQLRSEAYQRRLAVALAVSAAAFVS